MVKFIRITGAGCPSLLIVAMAFVATTSTGQTAEKASSATISPNTSPNISPNISRQATIRLSDVLLKFRDKASISSIEKALDRRSSLQIEKDTRRFPGAWTLGVASERPYRYTGDSKIDVNLKKSIALGIDRSSVARRYQAERDADFKGLILDRRERELQVTKLFIQLRKIQETSEVQRATLADIEPLAMSAGAAARLGTLGGFYATRMRLLVDGLRSDLRHSNNAFAAKVLSLAEITGLALPTDPAQSSLYIPDSQPSRNVAVTEASYLPVSLSRNRQESLSAMASQMSAAWEIEAGLGLTRNMESKETGVILELSVPLGSGSAAKSEVRAIDSERELLKLQTDFALERARDEAKILVANVKRLVDAEKIERLRIGDLESLLGAAKAAFKAGQGDLAEVIETLKELLDAKSRKVEIRSELADATAELETMTKGDVN